MGFYSDVATANNLTHSDSFNGGKSYYDNESNHYLDEIAHPIIHCVTQGAYFLNTWPRNILITFTIFQTDWYLATPSWKIYFIQSTDIGIFYAWNML